MYVVSLAPVTVLCREWQYDISIIEESRENDWKLIGSMYKQKHAATPASYANTLRSPKVQERIPFLESYIRRPGRVQVLPLLGSLASSLLQSRISFVPKLPSPPSLLLSQPPSRTTKPVALSAPSLPVDVSTAKLVRSLAAWSGVLASFTTSTISWSERWPQTPSEQRTMNEYSAGESSTRRISGSADTPMRFEDMSPNALVLASPEIRSSPNESVTKAAAKRRKRVASSGNDG